MSRHHENGAIGTRVARSLAGLLIMLAPPTALAQFEFGDWEIWSPSRSGIPGEDIGGVNKVDPAGNLWISARWPFWGEGGVARHDFAENTWATWSNSLGHFSSEYVTEVAFGPSGETWAATNTGLYRINPDGSIDRWTRHNSPLLHNSVIDVEVDSRGHVWVLNSHSTLDEAAVLDFDGDATWVVHESMTDIPWNTNPSMGAIAVDRNDRVYATNLFESGLAVWDGTGWSIVGQGQTTYLGYLMMVDDGDNVWTVSSVIRDTVYVYDGSTFSHWGPDNSPIRAGYYITGLTPDTRGNVYLGNDSGQILRFDGASWTEIVPPFFYNFRPGSMSYRPQSDELFVNGILSDFGSYRLSPDGDLLYEFSTYTSGMPDYFIEMFMEDSKGNIWMASDTAGISRFDGRRWKNWGPHNPNHEWPFDQSSARVVFEDSLGRYWVGALGVAIFDPDADAWTVYPPSSPPFAPSAAHIAEDATGTIWLASVADTNAIFWFDEQNQSFPRVSLPGAGVIQDIELDDAGRLWALGRFALYYYDGSWHEITELDIPNDHDEAFSLEAAPDDTLWIGTGTGLVHFDIPTRTWVQYTPANSPLPSTDVVGIDLRDDGVLALACSDFQADTPFPHGVCLITGSPDDPANWRIADISNSPLPHYQLEEVMLTSDGRLFINTISEGVATVRVRCAADLDGSGVLDADDFFLFLDYFASGDDRADLSGNGIIDVNDFFTYLDLFAAGC